jgi:thymidylate synthase (FAD)
MSEPIQAFISRSLRDKRTEGITKDVAFNRKSFDDGYPRNPKDNQTVQVGTDGIEVKLVQGINEGQLQTTLSRAINATIGVDLHNPPAEADWEEMLQGGLQTALETQVIVFEVSGVSRTCTHQLVRSRRAAFHQQSQRAHYYGDHPEVRCPESVWANDRAREAYLKAVEASWDAYRIACEENVSYQDARYTLPEATTNYILCEYTIREFLDVYAYRACSMFSWEIVSVMRAMGAALTDAHPWMKKYVKISCEKTSGAVDLGKLGMMADASVPENGYAHACTFQGWEEVDGQCDFPWARESNRTFRSKQHAIKQK